MIDLIIYVAVALVVWRATWIAHRWLGSKEELPEPRRPFLSELEERKLERELGIGSSAAPVQLAIPLPNIRNANGELCYEVTRDDVAEIAVELIAKGQARDVKAALEDLMVSKVSHLEDHQLVPFVHRLQEYAEMDVEDGPF